MTGISKRQYWCIGCGIGWGLTLLILGISLPFILDSKIKEEAAKQTIMSKDNYDMWGEVPGSTGAVIRRKFTFFDFINPLEVMFADEKPKFVEKGPFIYQELQNFTNPIYSEDRSEVEYDFWVHFKKLDDSDETTQINFANFIAFGAWYQMNHIEHALMSLQTLGQLIYGFEEEIYPILIVSGYVGLAYPSYDYQNIRKTVLKDLPEEQAQFIWSDQYNGMWNVSSLIAWYNAVEEGDTSGSSDYLRDYFHLSLFEMERILAKMRPNMKTTTNLINSVYCQTAPEQKCTNKYLMALQWAQSGITMNPPLASIQKQPSVIIGNNTAWGYPEFGYFQSVYFKENIDSDESYQELIDVNTALRMLNHTDDYSYEKQNYLSDPWILLNIGNIRQLLFNGSEYDRTKNETYLQHIGETFNVTFKQGRVLYEYVKYCGGEFSQQFSRNGNSSITALGGLSAISLYQEFAILQDKFFSRVVSDLLYQKFTNCTDILTKIEDITQVQMEEFCKLNHYREWNSHAVQNVIEMCEEPMQNLWSEVIQNTTLNDMQLLSLCDWNQEGFGSVLNETHSYLKLLYNCTEWAPQCSKFEIAVKQWANSTISMNPPAGLWTPTTTVVDIYTGLFDVPIEYNYFYERFKKSLPPRKYLNLKEISYLLSYDCLFSATMVTNALLWEINQDKQSFQTFFIYDEFRQLSNYLRYIVVEIPFGGVAQKRTVKEILFGYEHPFISTLAKMDPAQGGDPSAPLLIGLNINNTLQQTQKQSMYTGKKNNNMVRKYKVVNGKPYLTVPQPYFTGKEVTTLYKNPWNIESMLNVGTDSFCFHSDVSKDEELDIVVTDLVRSAKIQYHDTRDYYGLETYYMTLDEEFYQINETFNNLKYVGLVNFTTVQSAPILNSFAHFYNADPALATFVDIYKDPEMKYQQFASKYDASYVQVEPITGVALSALLNLQINVEYKPDFLFPSQNNYALLPILWVYRGANFTESQVDDFFGPLKIGIKLKSWIRWVGISVGTLLLLVSLLYYFFQYKKYSNVKKESLLKVNESQGNSLQTHEQ